MNDVKIQWLTSDENLFELDWLKFLFSDVQDHIDIEYDYRRIDTDHNTVVICNHAVPYRAVLDELRRKGKKYVIVLLSDENLIDPCEWLHDPNCVGCMRNYVHPNFLTNPKVTVFGLGYKRYFHKYLDSSKSENRDLLWSFAGTLHGDRKKAIDLFKDERPNKIHACSGFGAADGLGTKEYVEMLQESVFALCPSGQDSMDSFRIYEALEAGCIPITLENSEQFKLYPSYWNGVFRGENYIPFILGKTWEDCLKQVKMMREIDIESLNNTINKIWFNSKNNWKNKLTELTNKIKE
jgi:hypothetical protein